MLFPFISNNTTTDRPVPISEGTRTTSWFENLQPCNYRIQQAEWIFRYLTASTVKEEVRFEISISSLDLKLCDVQSDTKIVGLTNTNCNLAAFCRNIEGEQGETLYQGQDLNYKLCALERMNAPLEEPAKDAAQGWQHLYSNLNGCVSLMRSAV